MADDGATDADDADEPDADELPTAAEAIARCAATFDSSDTRRIANGTDRWNAYAGSSH